MVDNFGHFMSNHHTEIQPEIIHPTGASEENEPSFLPYYEHIIKTAYNNGVTLNELGQYSMSEK